MEIYTTGSRFFGTETAESDFDYFTADTEETRGLLESLGYVRDTLHKFSWKYANTTAVYEMPGKKTHIQLVRDVNKKIYVQELLRTLGLGEALRDKVLARKIWMLAYILLKDKEFKK